MTFKPTLPVVDLDVRLLDAGPAAVEAALGAPLGTPLVVFVGELDQATSAQLATLSRLPVIVTARSPLGPAAAPAVDVVVADDAALEQLRLGCARAPIAAVAAALLL